MYHRDTKSLDIDASMIDRKPNPNWSDWIKHDGKSCPLEPETVVQVIFYISPGKYDVRTERVRETYGSDSPWLWIRDTYARPHCKMVTTVPYVEYRMRRNKAIVDLLDLINPDKRQSETV